jgi:hypothetical protein
MDDLPFPIEEQLAPVEVVLTMTEAIGFAGSTVFDYIVDGEVENVPPGTEELTWWSDWLENLLGGNSEDGNCWEPCTDLPGIEPGEGLWDADFETPFDWF